MKPWLSLSKHESHPHASFIVGDIQKSRVCTGDRAWQAEMPQHLQHVAKDASSSHRCMLTTSRSSLKECNCRRRPSSCAAALPLSACKKSRLTEQLKLQYTDFDTIQVCTALDSADLPKSKNAHQLRDTCGGASPWHGPYQQPWCTPQPGFPRDPSSGPQPGLLYMQEHSSNKHL